MPRVYEYDPDSDRFESLTALSGKTYDKLMELGEEPLTDWNSPRLRVIAGSRQSDFPHLATHFPIVSDPALEAMRPYLGQAVDVLPVHVEGGGYHGLHVRDFPDCLDIENSEIIWFEPGRAELIRTYAFRLDACAGHHLFRLREYDLAHVYLSGELFDAIERAGLKGLKPTKIWEG